MIERFQLEIIPILPHLERRGAAFDAESNWARVLSPNDMESATGHDLQTGLGTAVQI